MDVNFFLAAMFRQHVQLDSLTSEIPLPSFPDIPISLRPSSGVETSSTVHLYLVSIHIIGDPESVGPLSVFDTTQLPYHSLDKKSKLLTPDPYHNPLRLDNQVINHPGQEMSYHLLPVDRTKNSLQFSTLTRNRELHS